MLNRYQELARREERELCGPRSMRSARRFLYTNGFRGRLTIKVRTGRPRGRITTPKPLADPHHIDIDQMGTICQCVFRFCCDPSSEENRHNSERRRLQSFEAVVAPHPHDRIMLRGDPLPAAAATEPHQSPPPQPQNAVCPPHVHGIQVMFQRLLDRWQNNTETQLYDIMRQQSSEEPDDDPDDHAASGTMDGASCRKRNNNNMPTPPASPHQATSFHRSTLLDIPCINSDEIVFPGSAIQKEMAAQLYCAKLKEEDVECVICMEPFSFDNPRMPTLCACGENKTFFHLPCLYQWIEQSSNCPSCRQPLAWEEF
jgi:hypothetical protein